MDIIEKCKLDKNVSHEEKYDAAINVLGFDNVLNLVPFSADRVKDALNNGDTHLNSLPIRQWDIASGISCRQGKPAHRTGGE